MRLTSREHAFTVVEVIIAVLLVTVVISGVTLALASGSKLETTRDTKSRMTAASERVYEHLRSDKDWVKNCRRSTPTSPPKTCNLMPAVDADLLEDDILGSGFSFVGTATGTGIDNSGDGLGSADMDGVVDDFFRIVITIDIPASAKARLGAFAKMQVSSIINGSTNANSGSLIVSICSADNQIDERVQISGCNEGGVFWTEMPHCENGPCDPWAISSLATMSLTAPSRLLGIRPMQGVSFSITRIPEDGGTATTVPSTLAVSAGPGLYRFPDLQEGTWKINTPAVIAGRIDWPTHHVPSTKRATVEKRKTARALVMLQDPAYSNPFLMKFERVVHERWFTEQKQTFQTPWIPECEEPSSFNQDALSFTSVTCNSATGHMVITRGSNPYAESIGLSNYGSMYESTGSFRETVTVTYVTETGQQDHIWQGAAQAGTLTTRPTPSGRWTKPTSSPSGTTYSLPTNEWTVNVPEAPKWPSSGYQTIGAKAQIAGLPAGLADPVHLMSASKINNVSTTWAPAGCDKRFIWVRTNNTYGTCSSLRMRGNDGECYTNMSSPTGGVYYTRDPKCSTIKWPPVGGSGSIAVNNNLIIRICTTRESRLVNIRESDGWAYDPQLPNSADVTEEEFFANQTAWGYTYYPGTIMLGTKLIGIGYGYFLKSTAPTNSSKSFNTGCRSVPSPSSPLDCPSLDRWDNCNVAYSLQIPNTPGWSTAADVQDGHRPTTSGGSIKSMSP